MLGFFSLLNVEADPSVAGQYICQAENKFGRSEQRLELAVTGISEWLFILDVLKF